MIGGGVGALLALLLAPKTGKQLRRDIRRKYEGAREAVEDFTEEARERVNDAVDRGNEWVESAREKIDPLRAAVRRK
jgi:gas vesicle protein